MALKRCENGHYFDPAKHTTCPSCGVQNINFEPTRKKEEIKVADISPPAGATAPAGGGAAAKPRPGDDGKTVSLIHKKAGIDPVVGWLVCVEGADRGRDYRIRSEKNFIGRAESMDVAIRGDETISRENHAVVSFNPKARQFKLHPGDSRGLVYLNGEEVDHPSPLKAGDHIELGQTKLLFVPLCSDSFTWE
jgi:Inner membrane component of T3SS, cytoplasmic domain